MMPQLARDYVIKVLEKVLESRILQKTPEIF